MTGKVCMLAFLGGGSCFLLVKTVYWGLFVRLGSGDEVGDT